VYALAMANLGTVYSERDEMAHSREWYRKALAVFDAYHPKHPDRMASLRGLANIALRTGDTVGAIPLYVQIRDARAAMFPPEHPERLMADYNLALAYQANKQLAEAESIVAAMMKNTLLPGKESWMLAARAIDLAAVLAVRRNDEVKAIVLRERALETLSHVAPSIENAYVLSKLGEAYLRVNKPLKAVGALEKAIAGYVEFKGDAYDFGVARYALARALTATSRDRKRIGELLQQASDDLARSNTGEQLASYRSGVAQSLKKYSR
jgi:tetratricopeptide (TPR) repeat protein